jgi:hypothetical protein
LRLAGTTYAIFAFVLVDLFQSQVGPDSSPFHIAVL